MSGCWISFSLAWQQYKHFFICQEQKIKKRIGTIILKFGDWLKYLKICNYKHCFAAGPLSKTTSHNLTNTLRKYTHDQTTTQRFLTFQDQFAKKNVLA